MYVCHKVTSNLLTLQCGLGRHTRNHLCCISLCLSIPSIYLCIIHLYIYIYIYMYIYCI